MLIGNLVNFTIIETCDDSFQQPLIPSASWREFVRAAAATKDDGGASLHSAIADLPMPHRDTLAYLCAHLQRVAERSTVNKMPRENLARCLAPTVVGYSTDSPTFQQVRIASFLVAILFFYLFRQPKRLRKWRQSCWPC